LLGQPTSESLKELYQNAEKAPTGLRIGVLATQNSITQLHFDGISGIWPSVEGLWLEAHFGAAWGC
jgi:hypothetical protein